MTCVDGCSWLILHGSRKRVFRCGPAFLRG